MNNLGNISRRFQVISSHLPCPLELKRVCTSDKSIGDGNFMLAMGGISASIQFSLPLMWTASKREGISMFEMHRLMSLNPATLAGLEHRKVNIQMSNILKYCSRLNINQ